MTQDKSVVSIDLSVALLTLGGDELRARLVSDTPPRLPFGPFFPHTHRTMESGLRQWVREQVGVTLGHVEQLYTFGDHDRDDKGGHVVSVGYLALTHVGAQADEDDWRSVYDFFPWEDWRKGRPACLDAAILPSLDGWAHQGEARERVRLAFGRDAHIWDEEYALERYELLYEAGLVPEAVADGHAAALPKTAADGAPLQLDHRRILATALGRLRGKLKYRPVIFDLMPDSFTLTQLQNTAEAVLGVGLHKQNFRRLVEKSGFLTATGDRSHARGRPAKTFRFRHESRAERPLAGLRIAPRRRQ